MLCEFILTCYCVIHATLAGLAKPSYQADVKAVGTNTLMIKLNNILLLL